MVIQQQWQSNPHFSFCHFVEMVGLKQKTADRVERANGTGRDISSAFETIVRRWLLQTANGEWRLAPSPTRMAEKKRRRTGEYDYLTPGEEMKDENDQMSRKRIKLTQRRAKKMAVFMKQTLVSFEGASLVGKAFDDSLGSLAGAVAVESVNETMDPSKMQGRVLILNGAAGATGRSSTKRVASEVMEASRGLEHVTSIPRGHKGPANPHARLKGDSRRVRFKCEDFDRRVVASSALKGKEDEAQRGRRKPRATTGWVKDAAADVNLATVEGGGKNRAHSSRLAKIVYDRSSTRKECQEVGCHRVAYLHGRCPTHGGRNKCRKEGCARFSHTRGLCQAHGGGAHSKALSGGKRSHTIGAQRAQQPGEIGSTSRGPNGTQTRGLETFARARRPRRAPSDAGATVISGSRGCVVKVEPPPGPANAQGGRAATRPSLSTPGATGHKLDGNIASAWQQSELSQLFRTRGSWCAEFEPANTAVRVEPPRAQLQGTSSKNSADWKAEASMKNLLRRGRRVLAAQASPTDSAGLAACKVKGCKHQASSKGFCRTHCRRKKCQKEGCSNLAVKSGRCSSHGGRAKCREEGCSTNAHLRGLCWKHGGQDTCQEEGCSSTACLRGRCHVHSGQEKCEEVGCHRISYSQGLCWTHGGREKCHVVGCNRAATRLHACSMHGARKTRAWKEGARRPEMCARLTAMT